MVERTKAWLGPFRRLLVRHEYLLSTYRAFLYLACFWITLRRCFLKHALANSRDLSGRCKFYPTLCQPTDFVDGGLLLKIFYAEAVSAVPEREFAYTARR